MTTEEAITNCPKINLDDYQFDEKAWKPCIGNVYKATDKKTGKKVAIRVLKLSDNKEEYIRFFIREVNTASLDLPGIHKIIGYRFPLSENDNGSEFDNKCIIVSEFMENGSLENLNKEYLKSNGQQHDKMNPTIRSKIIFGIAATMKRFHKMNIIHRDLECQNILLDDKLEPRITDFNYSINISDATELEQFIGTPIYMAPEIILGENYGTPVDVYSYGMLLYSMFTTDWLFSDKKPIRSHQQFIRKIRIGQRPGKPDNIPDQYWDLIQRCWKQEAQERPTFEEIVEILKDDKYALEEYGMKTDLNELHEYQARIDKNE